MVNPDRNLYEPPYDDALLYDSDLEPERPRSRPLVVLLGVVVLAAFAGVVWVAYNQGVKQGARGGPPILSADAGPTRIVPNQTDGTSPTLNPAPDKSYERLWGETPDRAGQENVLPKAEQPRTVPAPQDIASAPQAPQTTAQGPVGGPFESKASDVPPPADPRMDATTGPVTSADGATTGAPRSITGAAPASPYGSKTQSEDITSALAQETVTPPVRAPRSVTPPKSSVTKPVTATQTTIAPTIAKPVPSAATPVAPKVITSQPPAAPAPTTSSDTQIAALTPPADATPKPASGGGSVMIQLGSFPNDALAASAWSRIKSSNQALLGEYSPSIKPADIPGKGTWYRLRVGGFSDKTAAADVCEQLKAAGQACIIAAK